MHIVFHIGMGKTGSTMIQSALGASQALLRDRNIAYLGQWLGFVSDEFEDFSGFQRFLGQEPNEFEACADRLLEHVKRIADAEGTEKFLISNEQYLENIPKLEEFFRSIQQRASLEIVIYVRAPAQWLPSAVTQWGIVHKTNTGPVRPFGVTARMLMRQYDYIRQWRQALGSAVTVREYREGFDVVDDFLRSLGVASTSNSMKAQVRPSTAETVMRAAFNSRVAQMALPEEYNNAMPSLHSPFPVGLSGKLRHLFSYDEIPAIVAENADILQYIGKEFDIHLDRMKELPPDPLGGDALVDMLVGQIVDIVSDQALQIRALKERFEVLENRHARP